MSSISAAHKLMYVGASIDAWSTYSHRTTLLKKPVSPLPNNYQLPIIYITLQVQITVW